MACERVAGVDGVGGADIDNALRLLREGTSDEDVRARLAVLERQLDDEYFRLAAMSPGAGLSLASSRAFKQARAIAALVFAMTDDDASPQEAIYEALAAADNSPELVAQVVQVLARGE